MSKDGKYVTTSNEGYDVQMWNTADGKKIGSLLHRYKKRVRYMAINSDYKRVVTAVVDETIPVWNVLSGEVIWKSSSRTYGYGSVPCDECG